MLGVSFLDSTCSPATVSFLWYSYTKFSRVVCTHCFHVLTSQSLFNSLKSNFWPYQLIELSFAKITGDLQVTKYNGISSFSPCLDLQHLGTMLTIFSLFYFPGFHKNYFPDSSDLTDHDPPNLLGWLFLLHPTSKYWDSLQLGLGSSSLFPSKVLSYLTYSSAMYLNMFTLMCIILVSSF